MLRSGGWDHLETPVFRAVAGLNGPNPFRPSELTRDFTDSPNYLHRPPVMDARFVTHVPRHDGNSVPDPEAMQTSGLTRTANKYMEYYQTSLERWWDTMGPFDYMCVLIGSVFLGYLLLKSGARA